MLLDFTLGICQEDHHPLRKWEVQAQKQRGSLAKYWKSMPSLRTWTKPKYFSEYIYLYIDIYMCGIYLWIYGKFLEKFTLNLYIYIYKKYVYKNIYSVSRYKDCSLVHISLTFNWIQNQFGPFSFQYFQAFWDFSTRWGGSKLASPIASWENPKSATSTSCELQNSKYILMHFIDLFIFVDVNFLFHFFSFE